MNTVPLRRIASFQYGEALPALARVDGSVAVMSSGGVTGSHTQANTSGPTIVIGRKGSHGSIHWAPSASWVIDTAFFIDRRHSDCNLRWLYYVLLSAGLRDLSQDVGIPGLSREAAYAASVPVPPSLEEQRRIADFLDDLGTRFEAEVAELTRLRKLAEERHRASEARLLFGRDTTGPRAPSGIPSIGDIPDHWSVVPNKAFLRESVAASKAGAEELLSVSHLTGVTSRADKTVYMFLAEDMAGYKLVSPGDLVINTMWAWMGALGISPLHGIVSPAYGVYSCYRPDRVDSRFLNYLYRSAEYVDEMTRFSTGVWSSRLRLYPEVFLQLKAALPPISEQARIATALDESNRWRQELTTNIDRSLSLLQERRTAMITAAVSGDFDVTTTSAGHVVGSTS